MVTLIKGSNTLNVQMVALLRAEFTYTSEIRLIPITYDGRDIYRLEVDIQNIGDVVGVCHSRTYMISEAYGYYGHWGGVANQSFIENDYMQLNPGESGTFASSVRRNYPNIRYHYAVAGDAGIIKTANAPTILPCVTCYEETGEYSLFRTQEELDAHIAAAHPIKVPCPCGDMGDVDGDGWISENDVRLIMEERDTLTADQLRRADVNGDGVVDMTDALVIVNYLLYGGTFPVCL